MTGLRRALVALGVAAVAAGLLSLVLILTSDHLNDRGLQATFVLLIGWAFAGTGLFAWWRRPNNRVGPLMVAVGFAWLIQGLEGSNSSYVFAVGATLGSVAYAPLIHLIVAFPDGRLVDRVQRWAVGLVWFVVLPMQLMVVPFIDPPKLDGCENCPDNPFLVSHSEAVIGALDAVQTLLAVVAIVMVVVELRRRWRAAPAAQRSALAPVLWTGGITLVGIGLSISLDLAGVSQGVFRVIYIASITVLASVPFAFLAGLLRSRFTRAGAVSELVSPPRRGRRRRGAAIPARRAGGRARRPLARAGLLAARP